MMFEPYPAYKLSGVECLGNVPAHWEVRRLKYLLRERRGRSMHGNEQLLRVSQYDGVTKRTTENSNDKPDTRAESLVGYKCVGLNDLVVNIMLAWNGSMGVSQYNGIVSPAYCVYRFSPSAYPRFLHHLLRCPMYKAYIKAASTGVVDSRLRLYTDNLYQLYALVPPFTEQASIVRYLDHVDRRIRRYVAAKQKLIALLEEEKQAVVNRAVTRGLDPNVPLKPSGVEWLGDVPAHWGLVGLKLLSRRIQNGSTPSTLEPKYYESGTVPWYGPSSCKLRGQVGVPIRYLTQDAFNAGGARLIKGPALLIVVIGATAGRMALLAENGSTNQQITSFEVNTNLVHPMFVLEQAGCAEHWLRATASTATIPILDADVVCRLPVAVPPLGEQTRIVEHVENFTPGIDNAIARARRQIELIQEYRTRLIADVVTGKLDVREAAARLPEEAGASTRAV